MTKPLKSSDFRPFSTTKVIQHIQQVVKTTAVPTWFQTVPSNVGDAAAGTLKAAEWRSLATLYLPLALTTLWGEGTSHPSEQEAQTLREILDNSMILFIATRMICSRTMTRDRVTAIRACMSVYVRRVQEIHPHFIPRPNHHMAQHIADFLDDFGPVHSWWCFPFENLIGILQRLPTNHKSGGCIKTTNTLHY